MRRNEYICILEIKHLKTGIKVPTYIHAYCYRTYESLYNTKLLYTELRGAKVYVVLQQIVSSLAIYIVHLYFSLQQKIANCSLSMNKAKIQYYYTVSSCEAGLSYFYQIKPSQQRLTQRVGVASKRQRGREINRSKRKEKKKKIKEEPDPSHCLARTEEE